MLTCRRLALAILAFSAAAAAAQPAVPPLRTTPAPKTAPQIAPQIAPVTSAAPAPAPQAVSPVPDPDAPPTSMPTATAAPAMAARPAAASAAADAPPTSDAAPTSAPMATAAAARPASTAAVADAPPTSTPASAVASAAPNAAPDAAANAATPAVLPTVPRDFPTTPEGNARFLAEYASRPDVQKLDGGVLYRVLRAADPKSNGPIARGDTVTVSYRGWLIDGTAFDQTKLGNPVQFTLNSVVPGWRTALMKMKVGDLWEVAIPADQGYGAEGRAGRIPPNQTLIFVISLAKVEYAG